MKSRLRLHGLDERRGEVPGRPNSGGRKKGREAPWHTHTHGRPGVPWRRRSAVGVAPYFSWRETERARVGRKKRVLCHLLLSTERLNWRSIMLLASTIPFPTEFKGRSTGLHRCRAQAMSLWSTVVEAQKGKVLAQLLRVDAPPGVSLMGAGTPALSLRPPLPPPAFLFNDIHECPIVYLIRSRGCHHDRSQGLQQGPFRIPPSPSPLLHLVCGTRHGPAWRRAHVLPTQGPASPPTLPRLPPCPSLFSFVK
jgi:hypothetical protein